MLRHIAFVLLLATSACGDGGGDSDAAIRIDSGADAGKADAGHEELDAGPRDAGALTDAGVDAGSAIDAGSPGCPYRVDDHLAGVCDGRGREGCRMWAEMVGGSSAVAQCVPPEGRCARADACDATGCTCGGAPECGDDQACVSGIAGFSCVCLSPPP